MDDRKKLVELLKNNEIEFLEYLNKAADAAISGDVWDRMVGRIEFTAEYLIANGVTVATDNNVGDKLTPTATHGDRIRSMDDIDLAEFLCSITDCYDGKCPAAEYCSKGNNGMKVYLHQRVEEE